ncbi:MAG: helix-turn-helix transcriptional regulator, partial [Lamprobacter sp.]|uniref:helix-turn-helix domain-containing protein n=1 Tax=Lamprobacter sp. TaxID=3100796 RepID=UPI002B26364F
MSQETGIKNRLLEARKGRGLTQTQLAERVGLSQAHISSMEKMRRGTPMPKWREIAKELDVDLKWLLADEAQILGDDEQWLMTVTDNPNLPFGLKELLDDIELMKGLRIDGLEWSVLESLEPAL